MRKNLFRSIQRSLTRYIAIAMIIALGAALFVGLLATKTDMVATGQEYLDQQNMFDLRLLNSYGWSEKELAAISKMEGVVEAEGIIRLDVNGTMGTNGSEKVYQLYAVPESVNMPYLLGGRMPEAPNECLADGGGLSDAVLGTTFCISDNNEDDTLDGLKVREYTVVGYVSTPLFMDMTRGNTALGNGSIAAYVYIPREAFAVDYYAEIHVTIPGDYEIYTDAFNDAMELAGEKLKPALQPLAQQRYQQVLLDARQAYNDGLKEYEEGMQSFLEGKEQAEKELADALLALENAQSQMQSAQQQIEDGQAQINAAWIEIRENEALLQQSQQTLDETKEQTLAPLNTAQEELDAQYDAIYPEYAQLTADANELDAQLDVLDQQIAPIEEQLQNAQTNILLLTGTISTLDLRIAALEAGKNNPFITEETLADLERRITELEAQRQESTAQLEDHQSIRTVCQEQLAPLYEKRQPIQEQRQELEPRRALLETTVNGLQLSYDALNALREQAEAEFISAQEQIDAGYAELNAAKELLIDQEWQLQQSMVSLEAGKKELEDSWRAYYEGKAQVEKELAEAEQELFDGKAKLDDAAEMLASMTDPEVYVLDRNTNAGYVALDSNSDIVAGVSRVFPAFFLLVAALICITTMTRMVEEERTQIGTLKALGYSGGSIISKYLLYAGSAAVLGCGLGVFAGSIIFPKILWTAYSLILNLTPQIKLVFNVPLCVGVTAVYTIVICFVTWYCCRMSLREVPAELIRPKPPTTGRKIFLEHLPFWDKFSFLNKVMLRNIFRYRQRLLMMLVGIGGCTALLITGFGIGDSITDIVSIQFEEVNLYDIQVQFADGRSAEQQEAFLREVGDGVSEVSFAHQSGVEIDFGDMTKSVYMICPQSDLDGFFDFHRGDLVVQLPDVGEAILSSGTAETMGVGIGDTIRIRNSDLQVMDLKVSGVYDNHVYNYVFVAPETVAELWGKEPQYQQAYICTEDDIDPHTVSAKLSAMDDVMMVMVNQDLADQVGSMLEAMDLIVATVVVCAGLLAVIVLYNLTNINITERLREIATIKVLGFTAMESAAYVFKENLILSVMGTFIGLFGGKFLLDFVMSQIKIDMVWFQARILPLSMVGSVVITLLMAVLVDFILYFKLGKINMAEALKPVE